MTFRSSTPRTSVLGIDIDRVDMPDVAAITTDAISNGNQTVVIAANSEKIINSQNDIVLAQCLADAQLVLPDGIGCVFAARILHGHRMQRVAGADAMPVMCEQAQAHNRGIFLLGGTEEVNQLTAQKLQKRFPELPIVGRHNGFFSTEEETDIVAKVNASGARYLFVALGTPRQEKWIHANRASLQPIVIVGVGGTFDVIAGKVMRAPTLFRRLNLEWLFRLLSNPRRALRQTALLKFIWQVMQAKFASTAQQRSLP